MPAGVRWESLRITSCVGTHTHTHTHMGPLGHPRIRSSHVPSQDSGHHTGLPLICSLIGGGMIPCSCYNLLGDMIPCSCYRSCGGMIPCSCYAFLGTLACCTLVVMSLTLVMYPHHYPHASGLRLRMSTCLAAGFKASHARTHENPFEKWSVFGNHFMLTTCVRPGRVSSNFLGANLLLH